MLLQLAVSCLVTLVNLKHHCVEFAIQDFICVLFSGAWRGSSVEGKSCSALSIHNDLNSGRRTAIAQAMHGVHLHVWGLRCAGRHLSYHCCLSLRSGLSLDELQIVGSCVLYGAILLRQWLAIIVISSHYLAIQIYFEFEMCDYSLLLL